MVREEGARGKGGTRWVGLSSKRSLKTRYLRTPAGLEKRNVRFKEKGKVSVLLYPEPTPLPSLSSLYNTSPSQLLAKDASLHGYRHRRRDVLRCLPYVRHLPFSLRATPVSFLLLFFLSLQQDDRRHRIRSRLPTHHHQEGRRRRHRYVLLSPPAPREPARAHSLIRPQVRTRPRRRRTRASRTARSRSTTS